MRKSKASIHLNPDWQTVGSWQYNVAAPSGLIWHRLAEGFAEDVQPAWDDFPMLNFAVGHCGTAFYLMSLDPKKGVAYTREITPYTDSVKIFKRDMNKLASDLFEGGW